MIDHIGIKVANAETSKAFYIPALEPLGYKVIMEFNTFVGMGTEAPDFWLYGDEAGAPVHVAFRVNDRALVDAFHAAAIAAGGTDNGAPGLREHYHANYYGAFVLDPDGHNIEAVCHLPV